MNHRVVDGADADKFLADVKKLLQEFPEGAVEHAESPDAAACACPRRMRRVRDTLRELSQFAEARGQRIWLVRNAKDSAVVHRVLGEPHREAHRAQASRLAEEIKLEKRLQALATYAPDAWSSGPRFPSPRRRRRSGHVTSRFMCGRRPLGVYPSGRLTVYGRDQFVSSSSTGPDRSAAAASRISRRSAPASTASDAHQSSPIGDAAVEVAARGAGAERREMVTRRPRCGPFPCSKMRPN